MCSYNNWFWCYAIDPARDLCTQVCFFFFSSDFICEQFEWTENDVLSELQNVDWILDFAGYRMWRVFKEWKDG